MDLNHSMLPTHDWVLHRPYQWALHAHLYIPQSYLSFISFSFFFKKLAKDPSHWLMTIFQLFWGVLIYYYFKNLWRRFCKESDELFDPNSMGSNKWQAFWKAGVFVLRSRRAKHLLKMGAKEWWKSWVDSLGSSHVQKGKELFVHPPFALESMDGKCVLDQQVVC